MVDLMPVMIDPSGYVRVVCGADFWVDEYGYYYDINDNMMPFEGFD